MLTGPTAAPAAWRSGTPGPVLLRPMLSTADIHFTPHIISTAYTCSHRESGYYRESSFQLSIITFICLVNVSRSRAVCIVPQSRHYAGLFVLCLFHFRVLQLTPVVSVCMMVVISCLYFLSRVLEIIKLDAEHGTDRGGRAVPSIKDEAA